jgi:hypothetical protein
MYSSCICINKFQTENAYLKVLKYATSEFNEYNPTKILTDNEQAAKNAFSKTFPSSKLFKCWKNFRDSIYKVVVIKNLVFEYSKNFNFKRMVWLLRSMVFVQKESKHDILLKLEFYIAASNDVSFCAMFSKFLSSYCVHKINFGF